MIWIILAIGFLLRLISLNQSLWLDEAINVLASKNYSLIDLITQYARADFHPPGYFLLSWFWTKLFGYSEIAIRIPSVIFGVLTIWVTYLIGKKLVSKKLGIIAALLLCFNPLHISYSQEARMYSLAALAVSINILLLIKLAKGEKLKLIFLIASNLLVLGSDYVAYFIFPAQIIILFLFKKKQDVNFTNVIKKWFAALLTALILGVWWLPIFFKQLNVGSVASAKLPTWKFVVGAFDFKTLPLTFVKFIIGRISLTNKLMYAAILLPVSALFVYLIGKGVKSLNVFSKKILITWIAIPPLIATLISFVVPVYSYFRVLFVLPGFILLVSAGILSFKFKFRYLFLTSVVFIEMFCSLVYLLNPVYQREDWKGLVTFLKVEAPNSTILFESSGTLPPFDYYAVNGLKAKGALRDFPAKNKNDVADLQTLLADSKDLYLIDYLVDISDPNRLVAKELDNLEYKKQDIKNFNGVGFVYHYTKK